MYATHAKFGTKEQTAECTSSHARFLRPVLLIHNGIVHAAPPPRKEYCTVLYEFYCHPLCCAVRLAVEVFTRLLCIVLTQRWLTLRASRPRLSPLHGISPPFRQFLRVTRPRVSLQQAATKSAQRLRQAVSEGKRATWTWTWARKIRSRWGRWRGAGTNGDGGADSAQTPRVAHRRLEKVSGSESITARLIASTATVKTYCNRRLETWLPFNARVLCVGETISHF